MTVEDAALEVAEGSEAFLVFRNAQTDSINVLYRRKNGDLALIEGFDRVLVFDRGALSFDGEAAGAIAHYRRIALT